MNRGYILSSWYRPIRRTAVVGGGVVVTLAFLFIAGGPVSATDGDSSPEAPAPTSEPAAEDGSEVTVSADSDDWTSGSTTTEAPSDDADPAAEVDSTEDSYIDQAVVPSTSVVEPAPVDDDLTPESTVPASTESETSSEDSTPSAEPESGSDESDTGPADDDLTPTGVRVDEIIIAPDQILRGDPGTINVIATETVDAELVGLECDLRVTMSNGGSVHRGNNAITTTGDSRSVMEDVEAAADGEVAGVHRVVLGERITVELQLGPDGVSSMGFTVGFECTPEDLLPVVEPSLQERPPEAPPATPRQTTPNFAG